MKHPVLTRFALAVLGVAVVLTFGMVGRSQAPQPTHTVRLVKYVGTGPVVNPGGPDYRYVKQPSWLFIDYASRAQRWQVCGDWPHTHTLIPGVLVTSGDTAVLFCKNGEIYTS